MKSNICRECLLVRTNVGWCWRFLLVIKVMVTALSCFPKRKSENQINYARKMAILALDCKMRKTEGEQKWEREMLSVRQWWFNWSGMKQSCVRCAFCSFCHFKQIFHGPNKYLATLWPECSTVRTAKRSSGVAWRVVGVHPKTQYE